jgi:hypothetical protein
MVSAFGWRSAWTDLIEREILMQLMKPVIIGNKKKVALGITRTPPFFETRC